MKLVSKPALVRLALLLLAGWAVLCYMAWCPAAGPAPMNPTTPISAAALRQHVQKLAGEIGERNTQTPVSLNLAAKYIETQWRAMGLAVERQSYAADGVLCHNLSVTRTGAANPNQIILVGAHYDTVPGSPGANDNTSGVAALLELSRVLDAPNRTVRFVAFVNEEPPYFQTPLMGSRQYASAARERSDDIRAMVSLETMGHFSHQDHSQQYPAVFRWFYPSRGNFIAFVSDLRSRSLMHRAVKAFRGATDFPVQCCATFAKVPGVDWSDHGSFWAHGYRAFMVTDTAPYRYAHYHTAEDTPDKLDYESLAKVTTGLASSLRTLAEQ